MPYAASVVDWVHWFAIFVLTAALIAAALNDLSTYLIPHRYSIAIAAAFLVFATGRPLAFLLTGLAAGTLLFALGALLFARRLLGGGDVKLLAAAGLWAGFDQLALLIFASAIAGGILATAKLSPLGRLLPAPPGRLLPAPTGRPPLGNDFYSRIRQPMPFGVAIALGGVCVALARLVS
jgi:prepilin peptidase CpaA